MKTQRYYICIDLKSFYASVECVERRLDPMTTNLVVADPERTDKTICLAVSPSLKQLGVKNRCRLFEVPKNIDFIIAPPRMQLYIDYSANIYGIYLKYFSKDDIHVYSIDEVFIDVTDYLMLYKKSPKELGLIIINDIKNTYNINATCGVGTNLYLAKIALDITAKHSPDFIGELNEDTFKQLLWDHKPLTDFWRIGRGIAARLMHMGIATMRDITKIDEDILYKEFGIDAELLIDHAYGRETTTMEDIKNYKSVTNSLSSGQVLSHDYNFKDGELIVKEMTDSLCLDLVSKNLVCKSMTLHISYSGHTFPSAHSSISLDDESNADILWIPAITSLYREIVNPDVPIRRVNITANNVIYEEYHQYSLFTDTTLTKKNHKMQKAVLDIKEKFGKNSILKGMNFEENATMRERNTQIGGHKSGI